MTKIAALLIVMLAACTSETSLGPCIGAFDDGDPKLFYRANAWNIAMAIVFVELIIPTVVVVVNETKCPVARRETANQ